MLCGTQSNKIKAAHRTAYTCSLDSTRKSKCGSARNAKVCVEISAYAPSCLCATTKRTERLRAHQKHRNAHRACTLPRPVRYGSSATAAAVVEVARWCKHFKFIHGRTYLAPPCTCMKPHSCKRVKFNFSMRRLRRLHGHDVHTHCTIHVLRDRTREREKESEWGCCTINKYRILVHILMYAFVLMHLCQIECATSPQIRWRFVSVFWCCLWVPFACGLFEIDMKDLYIYGYAQ